MPYPFRQRHIDVNAVTSESQGPDVFTDDAVSRAHAGRLQRLRRGRHVDALHPDVQPEARRVLELRGFPQDQVEFYSDILPVLLHHFCLLTVQVGSLS